MDRREKEVMGKFHYKDGWYFERLEDGAVKISYPGGWIDDKTQDEEYLIIDPASWASIVASVSKLGDVTETFQKAIAFHQGDLS